MKTNFRAKLLKCMPFSITASVVLMLSRSDLHAKTHLRFQSQMPP